MPLITTPGFDAPDDAYQALIEAHRGLSEAESHAMNARLILLLANHIGSLAVLREALAAARIDAVADAHSDPGPAAEPNPTTGRSASPQPPTRGVSA